MKNLAHILTIIACLFSPALFAENTNNDGLDNAYIAGFLAGAQLTDNAIVKQFDSNTDNEEPSDFFKRAFKTRVGKRQSTVPATYYAGFCLPENTSEEIIIDAILTEVKNASSSQDLEKASAVYLALRNLYPCK